MERRPGESQADDVTLTLLLFGMEKMGTSWHADWADAFNIAFALSKEVNTTMLSAGMHRVHRCQR